MSIPLCNCNRHFSFPTPKTLNPNPKPQIPNSHFPIPPPPTLKSVHRRQISAAATSSNSQTLPQSAIHRIAEKLRSLGYVQEETNDDNEQTLESSPILSPNSPGEIFVPLRTKLPKFRVGHTLDTSWSTPENPVPEPGSSNAIQRFHEVRRGVLEERIRNRRKEKGAPSLAELTLSKEELRRLRSEGIQLRKKLKVGKAGITEGIVNGIHERWRRTELVKITCEDICRLNMKRTHDLLERKTGGLVIWRSGSNIILYRGTDYKYPYFLTKRNLLNDSSSEESDLEMDETTLVKPDIQTSVTSSVESPGVNSSTRSSQPSLIQGVGLPNRVRFELPGEAQLAEEADALLEGLGPRFNDWWGYDPLPVDADLLPAVVPGYRRPFRLLPFGVKNKLTNDEMTTLRRLCRPLPCHFALGRNRKHQGLAASIVKLWEKCEIAKIAVKRGVQNTNSELMAEELKWLTGGTLLSRDKDFIVFYRGKDFLPAAASSAIEERRKYEMDVGKANIVDNLNAKEHEHGTECDVEVEHNEENGQKIQGRSNERRLRFPEAAMEKTSTKLSMALEKKARAEKLLAELEKEETRQPLEIDKEGITEEERYMLRKVGLRMKAFLLLGRRGVFDGTVENMHLHWKYRELVKVCIGRRSIEEVQGVARTLEAESGGILVAVERVSKGYAIIVYRGKNYKRPAILRPQTLLSKREAMKRSLEAQRRESLKLHVLELNKNINGLKRRLAKDENTNDMLSTKNSEPGYVKDEDTNNNYRREDKVFLEDSQSDDPSYFEDTDNEEARENLETDVTAKDREDTMHTSITPEHVDGEELAGDIYSPSEVKKDIKFDMSAQELESVSAVKELEGSLNVNEQSRNVDLPNHSRSWDQTNSSAWRHIRPYNKVMDSDDNFRKVKFEATAQKSIDEKPAVVPFRNSQLSNKERLLLRKQALKMKKPPVLSIGKSNVVAGVAKAIKQHFEKHPLAIVNIKGRAKGTSIQEVIYNLEQATGAVLVSQEPSKVILYRGWGAGPETGKSRTNSGNGEMMARSIISPELISAIRLECGLDSANEGNLASMAVTDGN